MVVEEKDLNEEEKAKLLEESSANQEDVNHGKIYTVSSVKIMRSDKEFFEETAKTILDVKKCLEKVKPEKEKIKQKAEEIKKKIEAAKKAQKNQANEKKAALRALSGRPTKMNQGTAKKNAAEQQQQPAEQKGDRSEIEALENDLAFCKGAENFIDNCGKDAQTGLTKLEGIMASGKVESWSVLVDFEVAPLPSEREKAKEEENDKNKENEDKDKDNNDKDSKDADKSKDKEGSAKSGKDLKSKFDAIRGINNSERQVKSSESGKVREAVRGPETPPLTSEQLNPNLMTYLKDQGMRR